MPRADRKCFLLAHFQTIDTQSYFTVSEHAFLITSPCFSLNLRIVLNTFLPKRIEFMSEPLFLYFNSLEN